MHGHRWVHVIVLSLLFVLKRAWVFRSWRQTQSFNPKTLISFGKLKEWIDCIQLLPIGDFFIPWPHHACAVIIAKDGHVSWLAGYKATRCNQPANVFACCLHSTTCNKGHTLTIYLFIYFGVKELNHDIILIVKQWPPLPPLALLKSMLVPCQTKYA